MSKTAKKTEAVGPVPVPATAGGALAALLALGSKSQAPAGTPTIVQKMTDPAISGAKPKKGSNTVVLLGFDQGFAERAKQTADLHSALEDAEAAFSVLQTECRDYGDQKRIAYNETFNADMVTVCIPYEVETATGKETKYVQAVCTNKYSVQQDVIQGSKEQLGEHYAQLFDESVTSTLKPNAEDLLRNLFVEQFKMNEDQVEATLNNLRDKKTVVKTKDDYEKKSRSLPEAVRTILDQGVKRQSPGIKIP